jgi:saccharopine dehydrogenase (NAD+, L-lysine-forming)
VEADWNLDVLEACIKAKVHCIDLGSKSKMTKKQLGKNFLLKSKRLIHITGCGSVPGVGNVMLRYAIQYFDRLSSVTVGYAWNSNIKKFVLPFSTQTLVEEFTEPADSIENDKLVKKSPMNYIEERNMSFVGKQKLFPVRHPEIYTYYHYFKDKGLKNVSFYAGFPEHSFNTTKALIDVGLGSKRAIMLGGSKIVPIEFLAALLNKIPFPKNYKEREKLWLRIIGTRKGRTKIIEMECLIKPLPRWEEAGSNVGTGIPVSIIAQMIKNSTIKEYGSFAPEAIVPPSIFFKELSRRGIMIYKNSRKLTKF